jgi:hypothetical protein
MISALKSGCIVLSPEIGISAAVKTRSPAGVVLIQHWGVIERDAVPVGSQS